MGGHQGPGGDLPERADLHPHRRHREGDQSVRTPKRRRALAAGTDSCGVWCAYSFAEWTAKQSQYPIDYEKLLDDWRNDRPEVPFEYKGRPPREAAAEAEDTANAAKED